MSAIRMDGKMVSAKVRGSILDEVNRLKERGVRPGLAVIIVGEDPASQVYVRNKERACEECGFYSEKYALPEETTQEQLLGLIDELNRNPRIDGILCQLPVPKHISEQAAKPIALAAWAEKNPYRLRAPALSRMWRPRLIISPSRQGLSLCTESLNRLQVWSHTTMQSTQASSATSAFFQPGSEDCFLCSLYVYVCL